LGLPNIGRTTHPSNPTPGSVYCGRTVDKISISARNLPLLAVRVTAGQTAITINSTNSRLSVAPSRPKDSITSAIRLPPEHISDELGYEPRATRPH
jgi:hypothetical protein